MSSEHGHKSLALRLKDRQAKLRCHCGCEGSPSLADGRKVLPLHRQQGKPIPTHASDSRLRLNTLRCKS